MAGAHDVNRRATPTYVARTFDIPGWLRLTTVELSHDDCAGLDASWGPRRMPADQHAWRWRGVYEEGVRVFGAKGEDGAPRFAWASRRGTPSPPGRNFRAPTLRLEFFEIAPELRGDGVTGALALAVVASEARRAGADQLLIFSLVGTQPFYASFGAEPVTLKAWKYDANLVPLLLDGGAVGELAERVEEHEETSFPTP